MATDYAFLEDPLAVLEVVEGYFRRTGLSEHFRVKLSKKNRLVCIKSLAGASPALAARKPCFECQVICSYEPAEKKFNVYCHRCASVCFLYDVRCDYVMQSDYKKATHDEETPRLRNSADLLSILRRYYAPKRVLAKIGQYADEFRAYSNVHREAAGHLQAYLEEQPKITKAHEKRQREDEIEYLENTLKKIRERLKRLKSERANDADV